MASHITRLTIVFSTVYSGAESREASNLRVTGLCAGDSPATGEFPAQPASNAVNVSISWRYHDKKKSFSRIVMTYVEEKYYPFGVAVVIFWFSVNTGLLLIR